MKISDRVGKPCFLFDLYKNMACKLCKRAILTKSIDRK